MPHVMLPNLQIVFFFICSFVESFKKVFMRYLVIGSIVIYYTTIIPNIPNKMADCIELRIVKSLLK